MSGPGFHHEAFFYADEDEFLSRLVPFLREGLENDEPALVAVGRKRVEALEGELGAEAEQVHFVDMEELGCNPARIIPFWRQFLDEEGGVDRPIRGIGEPVWPGRTAAEIDECQRHESLLNYAFWDGPAWRLLCPYDSSGLEDDVLEAAHRSHSFVSGSDASNESAAGEALDPSAVSPFCGRLGPCATDPAVFAFDRSTLREARALVAAEAGRAGLSSGRVSDLVAAVGELTANSVRHGGGDGLLSLWRENGSLVVDVEDSGVIEEPLTGRLRPTPLQESGRGLWMVNHLCDLVQVRSGKDGTIVRASMQIA